MLMLMFEIVCDVIFYFLQQREEQDEQFRQHAQD